MARDVRRLNRSAWDRLAERGNRWTVPVSPDEIAAARRGTWHIVLTPSKPVPADWFPELESARVLCLASGGGQQGPILAAAGARVTVFDNSPAQLERDRTVAARDHLELDTVEGDMTELGVLEDGSFDLIVHPVSNSFVADVHPVWSECVRVLRSGGELLAGFTNPVRYLFDEVDRASDVLKVVHSIPYSDLDQMSEEQIARFVEEGKPFEFSHTLSDQIAGQLRAGLVLIDLYEDGYAPEDDALSRYMRSFIATRARKP